MGSKSLIINDLEWIRQDGNLGLASQASTGELFILSKNFSREAGLSKTIEKKSFSVLENGFSAQDKGALITYDLLRFTAPYSKSFKISLYDFIRGLNVSLFEAVGAISNFFAGNKELKLEDVRGAFAELSLLLNDKSMVAKIGSPVYDFEKNGGDVEVKSISMDNRSVWFSNQQLSNNLQALVYIVEVIESANGVSVKGLLDKARQEGIRGLERYSFLETDSELINTKFQTRQYGIFPIKSFAVVLSNEDHFLENKFEFVSAKIQFKILPSALTMNFV